MVFPLTCCFYVRLLDNHTSLPSCNHLLPCALLDLVCLPVPTITFLTALQIPRSHKLQSLFRPKENSSRISDHSLSKDNKFGHVSVAALLTWCERPEDQVSSRSYVLAALPSLSAPQHCKTCLVQEHHTCSVHRGHFSLTHFPKAVNSWVH